MISNMMAKAQKVGRNNKNLHSELLIDKTMGIKKSTLLKNSSFEKSGKLHLYSEHVN